MKKTIAFISAFIVLSALFTACGNNNGTSNSDTNIAKIQPSETAIEDISKDTVLIKINTDGYGGMIAFADDGSQPAFNDEYPSQSAFTNVPVGTTVVISAKNDPNIPEDISFVKWQKNGEDFSTDATITVTADADAEYIALFSSGGYNSKAVDLSTVKTMGDLLGLNNCGYACTENAYGYVFEQNGNYYRAIVEMDKETADAYFAISFEDEDYESKQNALIAPLEVLRIDNLTEAIPLQKELDKWVGKTGKELMSNGWNNVGWNLEDMEFYFEYGLFSYNVVMEGEVGDVDSFDTESINPLVVKSVTYSGLGDAANPEISID